MSLLCACCRLLSPSLRACFDRAGSLACVWNLEVEASQEFLEKDVWPSCVCFDMGAKGNDGQTDDVFLVLR